MIRNSCVNVGRAAKVLKKISDFLDQLSCCQRLVKFSAESILRQWIFQHKIQHDSKLLSGFPWPIIFKPEEQNKTAYGL
jgi:DNA recombination-dependent growth factor C